MKTRAVIFAVWFYLMLILSPSVNAMTRPDAQIKLGTTLIDVSFAPGTEDGRLTVNRQQILHRIEKAAMAVSSYFNGFPVSRLDIVVNPSSRSKVNGTAYSGNLPMIILHIGYHMTLADLQQDWVLVHEMVHLAFPPMRKRHNWIEEGLATYVEPIARVRAGMMNERDAWYWLLTGTPKGLPERGDRGLDFTPTWGRRYWGGALFFLLADIQIHQQTKNRFGLQHALRAISASGGTMQQEGIWPITKALEIGDRATGTTVLMTLYNQMKNKPVATDLNAIWKRLGVSLIGNRIIFDNQASQSWLRRALITNK